MPKELMRLELPNEVGSIVLYDWMETSDGRNLVRLDKFDRLIWQATPYMPELRDCFVRVWWEGELLMAQTFSCFRGEIDVGDGSFTALEFTK